MKQIVLIEDDEDASHILTKVLDNAGYHVIPLKEGKAVLNQDFDVPDLYILDIDVPLIDGIALCKYLKLKPRTQNLPILLISGSHEKRERAQRAGADLFLRKPFTAVEFLNAVETLVNKRSSAAA